ncbi:MAG: hypothetical protein WA655_13815, partial [Candidatus Korobacteraceae bacterium]
MTTSLFGDGVREMSFRLPEVFFAYPSQPKLDAEIFRRAAEEISKSQRVHVTTWESLNVSGRIIIDEICRAIDDSQLFAANLTDLNANVMFELGYAIARDKRIWFLLDTSITNVKTDFTEFRLLTTVGYDEFVNSEQVVKAFYREDLINEGVTLFESHIKPSVGPSNEDRLLYLKSLWDTEASTTLTKRISASSIKACVDDPRESAFQSLVWYGQNCYSNAAVFCHFTSSNRQGSKLHNAKQALACGMAYGFGKPLLMVAEADYLAPLDYRDLLQSYGSAKQAVDRLEAWLAPIETQYDKSRKIQDAHAQVVKLATELNDFQFHLGDYVAENEAEEIDEYFVETSAYREALEGRQTIFVGRKGTGKTANFLRLGSKLAEDHGNLVCTITPVAYEIDTLVSLFKKYSHRDRKGYVLESLWKFLIYTEIANSAVQQIESRPVWKQPSESEKALMRLVTQEGSVLSGDFSVRLERAVKPLLDLPESSGVESERAAISELLHSQVLSQLRALLGKVLSSKKRVAVIVDNLDKPWTKHADID